MFHPSDMASINHNIFRRASRAAVLCCTESGRVESRTAEIRMGGPWSPGCRYTLHMPLSLLLDIDIDVYIYR